MDLHHFENNRICDKTVNSYNFQNKIANLQFFIITMKNVYRRGRKLYCTTFWKMLGLKRVVRGIEVCFWTRIPFNLRAILWLKHLQITKALQFLKKLTMSCLGMLSCAVSDANERGDFNKQFEENAERMQGIYGRKDIDLKWELKKCLFATICCANCPGHGSPQTTSNATFNVDFVLDGFKNNLYKKKLTFVILNSELNKIPVGVKNVTRKYLQINLMDIYAYNVMCTREQ
uniref:Uncharacterized protein n=1 Tax=Glossina palpalis gambiensis TaxID=67801 RepID=A0A1B0BJ98_9MUSC